ncbi:MAG TPA: class I SAM-dependent methyltransferase [Planktothrix sp.]
MPKSEIKTLESHWEAWAQTDPLFAVLTWPDARGGKWNQDDFFHTGLHEIEELMVNLRKLGIEVERNRALDFGCGVGRLSQALSQQFRAVVGVDISSTMIALSRQFDRSEGRCTFVQNCAEDLSVLGESGFDLVYTNIVLQHIYPSAQKRYIAEFLRILNPGGVAVFQIPERRLAYTVSDLIVPIRDALRFVVNLMFGKVAWPKMEMNCLPESDVRQIVDAAGAKLIATEEMAWGRPVWRSLRYYVKRV